MQRNDKLGRRILGAAITASAATLPAHRWDNYDFGRQPSSADPLDQRPFDIDQDAVAHVGRNYSFRRADPQLWIGPGRVEWLRSENPRRNRAKAAMWHRIHRACAQPLNQDGSLSVMLNRFDDPGWLKGV